MRTSDLPNNQSAAQRQQLGERLFGGAKWDTDFTSAPAQSGNVSLTTTSELVTVISTATLANGRIVKFLNHEPFVYFIRVENTTNQPVAVTARIFLVPTDFENDRTAWIEMDKFTATLAANQKAVLYRPDTESAVIKREAETSPTAIANRPPGGRTSYCDCGWPYTLLLPKGTQGQGMSFRAAGDVHRRDDRRRQPTGRVRIDELLRGTRPLPRQPGDGLSVRPSLRRGGERYP